MKKRVLCIFSIIFFLLISCTFLSFKIEDLMMTRVKTRKLNTMSGQTVLPLSVLFYDDFGRHLYSLEEGTGWESGERVVELGSDYYSVDEVRETVSPSVFGQTIIVTTATRQPIPGSQVFTVKDGDRTPDDLLLYYPVERTTAGSFPAGVTMTALSDNAMLLSAENTPQPYMEHQAKAWLKWQEMPMWRIFSLTETVKFLEAMPMVALLGVMMLLGFMLWGYSCVLARNPWENRAALWVNTGIGVAILCCLPFVLKGIDLPWAMLPKENILDFQHFQSEFGVLFSALEGLGSCSQAVNVLQTANKVLYQSLAVLGGGILVGVLVIIAEALLIHKNKKQ